MDSGIFPNSPIFEGPELSSLLGAGESTALEFALLDYPDHLNAGDHLLWVSAVNRLVTSPGARLKYCSSLVDFNPDALAAAGDGVSIVLSGGGNLGDIWPDSQLFRERIVRTYSDRRIIILPQSIFFSDPDKAEECAKVFDSHPDLTIFAREDASYAIAKDLFRNCRVIKAPDMVTWSRGLQLENRPPAPAPDTKPDRALDILYLCRTDAEHEPAFAPSSLGLEGIRVEDWSTYSWIYAGRGKVRSFDEWYWKIPFAIDIYREWWQRGLSDPASFSSRRALFETEQAKRLSSLPYGSSHLFSLGVAHDAARQIARSSVLITDRLHGQILASLLNKPSVLLPNSYHKNESYHRTWFADSKIARFAATPAELRAEIAELSRLYPR